MSNTKYAIIVASTATTEADVTAANSLVIANSEAYWHGRRASDIRVEMIARSITDPGAVITVGGETIKLNQGDTITFRGETLHVFGHYGKVNHNVANDTLDF